MKSGLLKAFILGVGITFLSSGMAFAATGEIMPSAGQAQTMPASEPGQGISSAGQGQTTPAAGQGQDSVVTVNSAVVNPDGPVSSTADDPLYQKQQEIDLYVFKENLEELKAKGITVVSTGVINGAVEIGITPFTDENAEYLYSIFGKDSVKVVEGQAVQIYGTEPAVGAPDSAPGAKIIGAPAGIEPAVNASAVDGNLVRSAGSNEIQILSAAAEESADAKNGNSIPLAAVYAAGALVVLGSGALAVRRKVVSAKKQA